MKPWKPFYCETNYRWGNVQGPEEWEQFKLDYLSFSHDTMEEVTRTLSASRSYPKYNITFPNSLLRFGLYSEYVGENTLADFFAENGMEL